EDLYAAGLIAKSLYLEGFIPRWDSTKIGMLMAEIPTQRIIKELHDSQSARRVKELGYKEDISFSLQVNMTSLVPQSKNSSIRV
ncbi:2-phosphosulfolactate phosphatase, partial [[Eubacterium] cellulosolvens]